MPSKKKTEFILSLLPISDNLRPKYVDLKFLAKVKQGFARFFGKGTRPTCVVFEDKYIRWVSALLL